MLFFVQNNQNSDEKSLLYRDCITGQMGNIFLKKKTLSPIVSQFFSALFKISNPLSPKAVFNI